MELKPVEPPATRMCIMDLRYNRDRDGTHVAATSQGNVSDVGKAPDLEAFQRGVLEGDGEKNELDFAPFRVSNCFRVLWRARDPGRTVASAGTSLNTPNPSVVHLA